MGRRHRRPTLTELLLQAFLAVFLAVFLAPVDFFAAVFFFVDLPLLDDFDFEEPPLPALCTSPSWITPVQPSTSSGSSSVWPVSYTHLTLPTILRV